MCRQDIFGHRYYQYDDAISAREIEDTRTVSIMRHNGAFLAECLDCEGDVTFYLEEFRSRNDLVEMVRDMFAHCYGIKIDEGG